MGVGCGGKEKRRKVNKIVIFFFLQCTKNLSTDAN